MPERAVDAGAATVPASCRAQIAGDFTDLVAHVWAHVRGPGPGNAYDGRYVAWARAQLGARASAPLDEDAVIMGRCWNPALYLWSELHDDIAAFRATARQPFAAVRPTEVCDANTLALLQAVPGSVAEIVHATLGLLAPAMQRLHAEIVAPQLMGELEAVRCALAAAVAVAPALAQRTVVLSWALGPRGRAMPGRIVVGAPTAWNDQTAQLSAVLALHEHAVLEGGEADYVQLEWGALTRNAARVVGADAPLRRAFEDWLVSLDLGALVAAAHERGWARATDIPALCGAGPERLERLAAAAR